MCQDNNVKISLFTERDASVFINIVQFANFIVTNNSAEDGSDVVTLLTGDNLDDRKKQQATVANGINHVGILQSVPIKYDQIVRFFSKYKK